MQVRKFEAKSMQEALKMVKKELGPEAIILAAKDNKGSFGLGGESSVEVTAAVSAAKLQQHQYALSRLRDQDREKLMQSPAKTQKKFIEKSVSRFLPPEPSPYTSRQYIDIPDDEEERVPSAESQATTTNSTAVKSDSRYQQQGQMAKIRKLLRQDTTDSAEQMEPAPTSQRVKQATQKAVSAFAKDWLEEEVAVETGSPVVARSEEILELKRQIVSLQNIVKNFKQMPQTFVPSHPGAEHEIPYELSAAYEYLLRKGMETAIAAELVLRAKERIPRERWQKRAVVTAFLAQCILDDFATQTDFVKGVHVFVGPSASGKTSSLIKIASRLVVEQRKQVAILSTDSLKLGATEQLKVYARILNVNFGVIRKAEDWQRFLPSLRDMDYILVDTPGLSLRNLEEIEWIKKSIPQLPDVKAHVHLVQAVNMKNADAKTYAERFGIFSFEDILYTKLDETTQHALIYNQMRSTKKPALGFSTGSKVPEDYEVATGERMVDLLFQVSK